MKKPIRTQTWTVIDELSATDKTKVLEYAHKLWSKKKTNAKASRLATSVMKAAAGK